jgi:hypothetical protein
MRTKEPLKLRLEVDIGGLDIELVQCQIRLVLILGSNIRAIVWM